MKLFHLKKVATNFLKYNNRLLICLYAYTVHCDPLKLFEVRFADLCDAIEGDPLRIVNRLSSNELIAANVRKDISSMIGLLYEKANVIVQEIQRHLEAHSNPAECIRQIGDFLQKQNDQQLSSIGRDFTDKLKNK